MKAKPTIIPPRRAFKARRRRLTAPFLLLAALLAAPLGCAAPKYENPIGVITNRDIEIPYRQAAMRQAQAEFRDDPARIKALETLVWDRGHPNSMRVLAIDQLVEYDEADFKAKAARRLGLLASWEPLERIFEVAMERNWVDFTPVVVRNYARRAPGVADADRMERKVIAALNPGKTVEQVVFEVFSDSDDSAQASEQTAAWELLCRITPENELLSLIAQAPSGTPLVADLQACAKDLHTFPRNREGVLWLHYLRDPAQQSFWEQARQAVARLTDEQRRGLALRHLPAVIRLDTATLALDRAALYARVEQTVRAGELHLKGPNFDGPMRQYPQRIGHWRDQLTWPDLAVISTVLQAMRDRELVAELFRQADADLMDTSTEHGGVLDETAGRFIAQAYPPLARQHDLKFIPRQEMVTHMYTGLAHYHFHAQSYRNDNYAGPGVGDLKLADTLNPNCLVMTFIDRDRLNVDYYQPGGAVVDLGTVRR